VDRRRGSLGAIITVPVLLIVIFGGARWWSGEDAAYRETIYRPIATDATVATGPRGHSVRIAVRDTGSQDLLRDPLMLDHGKPMHLFLVRDQSMSSFAHLHPSRERGGVFVSAIPALPEGRYLVFGDFVLETGAEYTVTTKIDVPAPVLDTISDPDDSWVYAAFGVPAVKGARSELEPGVELQWESADTLVAGRDVVLSFTVRGAKNAIVPVQPYLGMAGHAIVIREDGSVFVHLHPMGSMSMATLRAFELRNRGDTTSEGRLVDHAAMPMPMNTKSRRAPATKPAEPMLDGRFSFPFAFPKPGRYRVWVQVKTSDQIRTADFEVTVR
jgi:hypothetical protein